MAIAAYGDKTGRLAKAREIYSKENQVEEPDIASYVIDMLGRFMPWVSLLQIQSSTVFIEESNELN